MAVSKTPWQHQFENVEQRSVYLLTSGRWSDCTFEVGAETKQAKVPAHKLVLAMASPVFEAMFFGGLSEEEPISIPDIPSEAFKALLQYIYTGNIRIESFSMACSLWYGANKYMLPCLVKKCNAYICSVLDPGNACQAYELARLFEEKTLMDKCIKLISTKTKEVLNDSSFEDVEINTLITVCSLDSLNVDSELDLFHAVARYAEAEQSRQEQNSLPADEVPPSQELSDKVLLPSVENSEMTPADSKPPTEVTPSESTADKVESNSQTSPAAAIESKPSTEVTTSESTADKVESNSQTSPAAAIESKPSTEVTTSESTADKVESNSQTSPAAAIESKPSTEVTTSESTADKVESNSQTSPAAAIESKPSTEVTTSESTADKVESNSQTSPAAAIESKPSTEVTTSESTADKVESNSQTSPAAAIESKPSTEVTTSAPTDNQKDLKVPDKPSIRTAIKSIRFLTLSAAQFAECPPRCDLLTPEESLAIFMNIASADSPIPIPAGFSDCRQRRHTRSGWVDKGRLTKPIPKPSTESRGVAATKLPTPADIVRELSSRNEDTLEKAVRAARLMTCADAEGTSGTTQLVTAGCVYPLVGALDCPRTAVQYEAAWAIANIACDSDGACKLVQNDRLENLVRVLGRGGAVAEQAAWAIGNLARRGYKDKLVERSVVQALLARMQPNTTPAPLGTYVRTYRILCQQHVLEGWPSSSRYELLARAVPHVEALLELADEQVLAEACGVLDHLANRAKYNEQVFTPALCTRLVALLQPAAAPRVQTAALSAAGSMLRTTELRDRCLEAGCLDPIVYFLTCGNQTQVEKAAQATAYIMVSIPRNIQLALDKGILEALVPALIEGNDACKTQAALAVTYLCAHGSAPQLRLLAASAALQPYCRLLTAGTCLGGDVLRALTHLLQKVDHNTKPHLLLKLQDIGVPQLLVDLQQDKDKEICKLANDLLQTYLYNNQ